MKLAAVVDSVEHVCCRYRLSAFRDALKAAGHELQLVPLPKSMWGRWQIGRLVEGADAVVLQRKLLPWFEHSRLVRSSKKLLFDMDDAVWMRSGIDGEGRVSRKRERRFSRLMRDCEIVIAGNQHLKQHAIECGATDVVVVPTCVDVRKYPLAAHERIGNVDLVWVGSQSTLKGLEGLRTTLEAIGERQSGICLKMVCDKFLTLNRMPVVECRWTDAGEASDIASADIGISWIPDTQWSRGKCGLKVLQYMAAGLPVVANRVGVHPEMIVPGETGFLADTTDEWIDAINALSRDADLRRRIGANARRMVVERYSIESGSRQWIEILNRLG
jgi:glycosyltransferase involved in cell wall biosynthesis